MTIHLTLFALTVWAVAIFDLATPTRRMRTGQVKGTDFVHFYTLARLGATGEAARFADAEAQRRLQLEIVPESAADFYPPAYGPQVTLALAPLGWFRYERALALWLLTTTVGYAVLVAIVLRSTERVRRYRLLVALAAAASPAFWNLIIHGQLSILALAAIVGAFVALQSRRSFVGGLALGILAYKPPLVVPAVVILLIARAWRPLIGLVFTATLQILAAAVVIGPEALTTYWSLLLDSRRLATLLIAKPEQMHSFRAFWSLLVPSPAIASGLYVLSAGAAVAVAATVWRRATDIRLQMSAMVLGIVLAAPHLYVYDLVIVAPVWVWLVDWYLERTALPPTFGRVLYVGYLAPLLTVVTRVTHVQLSVLCFAALLWWVWQWVESSVAVQVSTAPAEGT